MPPCTTTINSRGRFCQAGPQKPPSAQLSFSGGHTYTLSPSQLRRHTNTSEKNNLCWALALPRLPGRVPQHFRAAQRGSVLPGGRRTGSRGSGFMKLGYSEAVNLLRHFLWLRCDSETSVLAAARNVGCRSGRAAFAASRRRPRDPGEQTSSSSACSPAAAAVREEKVYKKATLARVSRRC